MSDDRLKISELPIATAIEDNDYLVLSNTTPVTDVDDTQHGTRIIEARTFKDAVVNATVELFDSTKDYTYDAIVYYEDKVYYNGTSEIISAGSFDDTKWTETTLSELLWKTHFCYAEPYIEVEDYNEGDIVVHDYLLYECNTDETTGTWDDTKWDAVTMASIVNALRNDLTTEATARANADSALDTKVNHLKADLADEYDSSSTYNTDDVCTHDFKIYRCLDDNITGTWDGTKWEEVTVEELIEDGGRVKDVKTYGSSLVDSATKVANLDALTAVGQISRSAIASFNSSNLPMPSLKIGIEPVQDLHGYDAPWVGGAGKNKLPDVLPSTTINAIFSDSNIISLATNARVFSIPCQQNTNYVVSNNVRSAWSIALSNKFPEVGDTINYQGSMSNRGSLSFNTSTYTYILVCVENETIFNNLPANKSMIEVGSTATTWQPYANICPISGWSEANVSVCGNNIWDEEWEVGSIADSDGQDATNSNYRRSVGYISVKPNKTYYFNVPSKYGTTYRFYEYKQDKSYISYKGVESDGTFTTSNDCYFIRFRIATTETYTNDISINYPSTDTSYHAYNGQTITIDLDGTRYGGTLDVVRGVLTVEWIKWLITPSTGQIASVNLQDCLITLINAQIPNSWDVNINKCISDKLKAMNYSAQHDNHIHFPNENLLALYLEDEVGTTKQAWVDYLEQAQISVCYKIATPFEVQLNPTAITTLQGQNNVFADSGDVLEGSYIRDLTPFLDKILYKDLYATLSANATSLTITDDSITTDSTFDFFTDTYGVSPQTVSVSNGSMTMTFEARNVATKVKVRVML